ncbi:MAG: hypothetical protein K2L38_11955, partial [Dysosmobacter sp.]|nr:hypothetical protein [Dysosmobacter sp.]
MIEILKRNHLSEGSITIADRGYENCRTKHGATGRKPPKPANADTENARDNDSPWRFRYYRRSASGISSAGIARSTDMPMFFTQFLMDAKIPFVPSLSPTPLLPCCSFHTSSAGQTHLAAALRLPIEPHKTRLTITAYISALILYYLSEL